MNVAHEGLWTPHNTVSSSTNHRSHTTPITGITPITSFPLCHQGNCSPFLAWVSRVLVVQVLSLSDVFQACAGCLELSHPEDNS
jgi:hypothetical protein